MTFYVAHVKRICCLKCTLNVLTAQHFYAHLYTIRRVHLNQLNLWMADTIDRGNVVWMEAFAIQTRLSSYRQVPRFKERKKVFTIHMGPPRQVKSCFIVVALELLLSFPNAYHVSISASEFRRARVAKTNLPEVYEFYVLRGGLNSDRTPRRYDPSVRIIRI